MTLSEVTGITGEAGDFNVTVKEAPRYVDMDKCIACGACTEKCPKKVPSEYDAATGKRKAIFVKYAQAVPLKYEIDGDSCLRLNAMRKGKEAPFGPRSGPGQLVQTFPIVLSAGQIWANNRNNCPMKGEPSVSQDRA